MPFTPERDMSMQITAPPPSPAASRTAQRSATPAKLLDLSHDDQTLTLRWHDQRVSRFAAIWLRDNCDCPACRHPQAMERLYMFIDHDWPSITQVKSTEEGLIEVHFKQGATTHTSRFGLGWLRDHCYSSEARAEGPPQRQLWNADLNGAMPIVAYDDFMGSSEGLRRWIGAIKTHGVVLLQGVPTVPGKLLDVARRVGPVRQTNFGDHYDVISMPNPNAVAYTALGLELHHDLVNWRFPPDVQMLSCLKSSVTGGESIFTDGFRVAEDLRGQNPQAFALLSEELVEFRFHDASCDIRASAPMLALDNQGNLVRMRFNNWLRSSLKVPEEIVTPMYQAMAALWTLLRNPSYHLNLKLQPGELVAYDNNRVLHGRNPFDPSSGERHLQGCYMNMEDLDSALRLLGPERASR